MLISHVLIAGFFCGSVSVLHAAPNPPPETSAASRSAAASVADSIGLGIEGISLMNGENGVELWRLKASWGHVSREGDSITLDDPSVRYTLGDPELNDYIHVRSKFGRITDNQRHLRLWGDVVITRGAETVSGSVVTYDSLTRTLVFPEGAVMTGSSGSMQTTVLTWKLDDNLMTGEGGVSVLFNQNAESEPALEMPHAAINMPAESAAEQAFRHTSQN